MATVYPTVAGAYSTRTWNDDATGAAYGMVPQPGDTVKANGLAITVDVDITVVELQTTSGINAIAGGSFTTSGARVVNANSRAGTTNCLTVANLGTQNGNSFGGSTASASGTLVFNGGVQNGNATSGSANNSRGTVVSGGGVLNGNSYGGGNTGSNAQGCSLTNGSIQNGNAFGGGGVASQGTTMANGSIFNGSAIGGTLSGSHGVSVGAGCIAIIDTATGTVGGAFGVLAVARSIVLITNESGSFAKSLEAGTDTTTTNVPFLDVEQGGAAFQLVGGGGLVY